MPIAVPIEKTLRELIISSDSTSLREFICKAEDKFNSKKVVYVPVESECDGTSKTENIEYAASILARYKESQEKTAKTNVDVIPKIKATGTAASNTFTNLHGQIGKNPMVGQKKGGMSSQAPNSSIGGRMSGSINSSMSGSIKKS